jgi:hypothetical protein
MVCRRGQWPDGGAVLFPEPPPLRDDLLHNRVSIKHTNGTAPIQVYRVLYASGAQTRLDVTTPRGLTPLVGREEEVALLQRCWPRWSDNVRLHLDRGSLRELPCF